MISVEEADKIISNSMRNKESVLVHLDQAHGQVLAEDITTDRNYPPFNKAIMDGIAINVVAFEQGQRVFEIVGVQAAGKPFVDMDDHTKCYEIMTGAVVPFGCNCVIPIEKVKIEKGQAEILKEAIVGENQFISLEGDDCREGQTILNCGDVLTPPRIAFCAAVGKSKVLVKPKLKIAIVSTGDELIAPDEQVLPHQIRSSNDYFIQSILEKNQLSLCTSFHIKDNKEALSKELHKILNEFDGVVLSGGVSMGKFDLVPDVLEKLNVKQLFHKVMQKPGKPMWFGVSEAGVPVFGLPGNPVSSYTCCVRFVRKHLLNHDDFIILESSDDVEAVLNVTEYKMIKRICNTEGMFFDVISFKGSGDLTSITQADGFIEIQPEKGLIKKGDKLKAYLW